MKIKEFLKKHQANSCEIIEFLKEDLEMVEVWDRLISEKKWLWLIFVVSQEVFAPLVLRNLCCRIIKETPICDGKTTEDLLTDNRSKAALAYANGTTEKLGFAMVRQQACMAYSDLIASCSWNDSISAQSDMAYAAYLLMAVKPIDAFSCIYATASAAEKIRLSCDLPADDFVHDAQIKIISEFDNPFK